MADEAPIAWAQRMRRRNSLRVIGVGLVLLLAGGIYYYMNRNWGLSEVAGVTITHRGTIDPRLIGGVAAAIGALLTIAGALMFIQRRAPTDEPD